MKILLLTQWFEPEPAIKGLAFAKELKTQGHDVQVLTGFPNYPGGKIYEGYKHIHKEIGTTPARKRRELLAKAEIIYITAVEARDLFRPSVLRVAQRGWINLFNNVYFSQKLLDVDGQQVQVSIDIHDPSSVIIRLKDGTYVCEAMLDGNNQETTIGFKLPDGSIRVTDKALVIAVRNALNNYIP
ncbi:TPA: Mu transposase C-terminal domain-containing protein, partial [Pasteurella multocida]|nr:Mu transposase C-terminal domain-containing protein [Pasteurella multocida]